MNYFFYQDKEGVKYVNNMNSLCVNGVFRPILVCTPTTEELKIFQNMLLTDVRSVLSEEEFYAIDDYNQSLYELKEYYSGKKTPERFNDEYDAFTKIIPVINHLKSSENAYLHSQVINEEIGWVSEEYHFYVEEAEKIIHGYFGDYRDRGIIKQVYANYEELGHVKAYQMGLLHEFSEFFNFEVYANKLSDNHTFKVLSDGRIVEYNV